MRGLDPRIPIGSAMPYPVIEMAGPSPAMTKVDRFERDVL